ncbi:hypothetical protein MRX96_041870 [Rhipicephalus microplus]
MRGAADVHGVHRKGEPRTGDCAWSSVFLAWRQDALGLVMDAGGDLSGSGDAGRTSRGIVCPHRVVPRWCLGFIQQQPCSPGHVARSFS